MRVRGDNNPGTFSIEAIPNKPGWCLVRFYENAQEYPEQLDETTITGWEYDEYHLEQPTISQEDIEGNLEGLSEGRRRRPRSPLRAVWRMWSKTRQTSRRSPQYGTAWRWRTRKGVQEA